MIVIDSSALARYILKEKGWEEIENLLAEGEVLTLELAVKEVLNTVWKHAAILKIITADVAMEKYGILAELVSAEVILVKDQGRYVGEALRIALNHGITLYDSLFIAQAKDEKAELVTLDERQAVVASKVGVRAKKL